MTEAMYAQLAAAESQLAAAEQRAAKLKDVHAALAGLIGTGSAAEDRVQVEWSSQEGLRALHLDPRAMKMASEDLAAAIKQAITAATADLAQRSRRALLDSGAVDESTLAHRDPDATRRFIAEQRERLATVMRPAADQIADATARGRVR